MSNSVFQSVILQLKDISDRTFGVIDTEGCVVSCTDVSLLGERWPDAALKVGNSSESVLADTGDAEADSLFKIPCLLISPFITTSA